jgi:hypothetical protein
MMKKTVKDRTVNFEQDAHEFASHIEDYFKKKGEELVKKYPDSGLMFSAKTTPDGIRVGVLRDLARLKSD